MSRGKASGREGWLSNALKPVAEPSFKIVSGDPLALGAPVPHHVVWDALKLVAELLNLKTVSGDPLALGAPVPHHVVWAGRRGEEG